MAEPVRMPTPASVKSQRIADARGRLTKRPLPVGSAESLHAMRNEFSFFSMGLVYAHGFFREWMWADWIEALGFHPKVYFVKFGFPLFEGFDMGTDPDWNSVLFAVPVDLYSHLTDHLCSLAIRVRFSDESRSSMCRYAIQPVSIADPLAIAKRGFWDATIPPVGIDVVGIQTEKVTFAVQARDWRMLPRLARFPGRIRVGLVEKAMKAGQNPLKLVDDYEFDLAYKSTGLGRDHTPEQIAAKAREAGDMIARGGR